MSEPLEHPHGQAGEEEGEEEWESEDSWESDLDSEAEIAELMQMDDLVDDSASTGKQEYLAKCSELRIVPVAMFIAKLECEHINLRHHGMGVKGARALAAALLANSKIRSLNLGDNWFGDEGVLAVAEVACLPALRATARPGARARPCRSHCLPCSRHAARLPPDGSTTSCGRSWPPTRRSRRSTFRTTTLACPALKSCVARCRHAASPRLPPRHPHASTAARQLAGRARARTRRWPSTRMWCAYGMCTWRGGARR